ncbi:histone deacetylase complex subunit SAP30 [Alligator sinensis]|uniref:Histone deacetylase complex subunit SAP30 n=1 Tax=Alligator sinensis TaxID=38654 RepID=A0A3Q0GIK3_ALLSI|nr:histone deacetylase complex subunit SAP30 [Alligator sinensis]
MTLSSSVEYTILEAKNAGCIGPKRPGLTFAAASILSWLKARHLYICDFHKNLIQSVRNRRKRKGSDDDGDSPVQDIDTPEVDLYQLQVNTLRRYKRHFKLQTRPGLNKAQLVEIIGCHFRTIPVNEKDTLTYFIYSVKNDKNKPDLKMDSSVH